MGAENIDPRQIAYDVLRRQLSSGKNATDRKVQNMVELTFSYDVAALDGSSKLTDLSRMYSLDLNRRTKRGEPLACSMVNHAMYWLRPGVAFNAFTSEPVVFSDEERRTYFNNFLRNTVELKLDLKTKCKDGTLLDLLKSNLSGAALSQAHKEFYANLDRLAATPKEKWDYRDVELLGPSGDKVQTPRKQNAAYALVPENGEKTSFLIDSFMNRDGNCAYDLIIDPQKDSQFYQKIKNHKKVTDQFLEKSKTSK